jgi:hypothetical protein
VENAAVWSQGELCSAAAAHELHDLKLVAVVELSAAPAIPGDDLAIHLHRHAIALHPQLFDQSRKLDFDGKLTPLAIDGEGHWNENIVHRKRSRRRVKPQLWEREKRASTPLISASHNSRNRNVKSLLKAVRALTQSATEL